MIWLILALSFFFRTYRVSDFLGFWFDQGRDALTIWDLLKNHSFFLVGPTTGIEGIFLGPFYYYFIAPFYWLGGGNPVVPAIFLATLNTGTIYLMYRLTKKYIGNSAGLMAASLYGLSSQFISYNRWLSNPTPLPFFAVIAVWLVLSIIEGSKKNWHWAVLGLVLGLALQLEAASAIFFLPATAIIFGTSFKKIAHGRLRWALLAVFFGITLLPQLAFNLRNQNILGNSFHRFLVSDRSFQASVTNFYEQRLGFYYEILTNKFSHQHYTSIIFTVSLFALLIISFKKMPSSFGKTLAVWILTPVISLLFYHGNNGYVWDYYFTGVYPILCILIGSIYYIFWRNTNNLIRWFPIGMLLLIFGQNINFSYKYYVKRPIAPFIALTQINAAVDWAYEDAGQNDFNFDVYVPPMLYEAYKYVFLWRGNTKYHRLPSEKLVRRLYTLREPDSEHPQLLDRWMVRQSTIGSIEEVRQFGTITIERRKRFNE